MIKAFLSHSSVQKEYTRELANELGNDSCIFDERTFESGMPILSEIIKSLNNTDVFVLLLSDESLDSDWVKQEIMLARDLVEEGLINRFQTYIIDSKISYEDSRIKPWIKKTYLSSTIYSNPLLLARRIKESIRELSWINYPKLKEKHLLFSGRNNEISEIESKYYDGNSKAKKVVIASGFTGVGRKRILLQFMITKLNIKQAYEPLIIELSEQANVEDFILQLNNAILLYKKDEILIKLTGDKKTKIALAVELVNHIASLKEKILVRDNGACILSNGYLSTWFLDLIKNEYLVNQLILFITTNVKPVSSIEQNFNEIISVKIYPFNKEDRKKLFYAYIDAINIDIKDDDAQFFLDKFSGKPEQIFRCIDTIKENSCDFAKKKLDEILKVGNGEVLSIMNLYKNTPNAIQLLILLSKFEFISFDLIKRITKAQDNIDSLLESFSIYSITETLGSNHNYIRLNTSLSDYISRSKLKLDAEYNQELKNLTKDFIAQETTYELRDLSDFLFNVKELIKTNPSVISSNYLIPSFFLKTIIDQYKEGNYKEAVMLSEKILFDSNKFYDEITREIRYWMCLSLCRMERKDKTVSDKFFACVNDFDTNSKNFLLGFYYRFTDNYAKAEEYYSKVLAVDNMRKARREMVIVKTGLRKYPEALDLAIQNYEERPVNTYNIEAYFKCLIRKNSPNHEERKILNRLISEMDVSFDSNKEIISKTLRAEYKYYIDKDVSGAITDLNDLVKEYSRMRYYPLRSLKEIYYKQDTKHLITDIDKKYSADGL